MDCGCDTEQRHGVRSVVGVGLLAMIVPESHLTVSAHVAVPEVVARIEDCPQQTFRIFFFCYKSMYLHRLCVILRLFCRHKEGKNVWSSCLL